ncbi:transcriptional regulator, MarR family [Chitinophaga costaii]|uniref:Transcriptional regulator, MarR family n=1 Tax=Chitinophaga costaii TaxID=1335309 RepID=A0A1C3ZY80_9BACT|nr:MarR family transcriptional regulator [Chitinophaga costaii]PUZ30555.1 MarR family transcriptional regulator [Chitinophaga costaii]SCB87318.1 transcriptional regulator, MarR family [Chitinophaga costaii]
MSDTFIINPSFYKLDATLKKLRNHWQQAFDKQQKDITVDQWLVMENLYKHTRTTHKQLAHYTDKDITTISRILDLLVKKGLVMRQASSDDRRKVYLELTPAGVDKYTDVRPLVLELRRIGWHGLSEKDFEDLTRILDVIAHNLP